jgi:hypothetical protein
MPDNRLIGLRPIEPCSRAEIESLRKLKGGAGALSVSPAEVYHLMERGWAEHKYGGYVLSSDGRYQLELRAHEHDAARLVKHWQHRAEKLRAIADAMDAGDSGTLRTIAAQWDTIAAQLEDVHRQELQEPLLD